MSAPTGNLLRGVLEVPDSSWQGQGHQVRRSWWNNKEPWFKIEREPKSVRVTVQRPTRPSKASRERGRQGSGSKRTGSKDSRAPGPQQENQPQASQSSPKSQEISPSQVSRSHKSTKGTQEAPAPIDVEFKPRGGSRRDGKVPNRGREGGVSSVPAKTTPSERGAGKEGQSEDQAGRDVSHGPGGRASSSPRVSPVENKPPPDLGKGEEEGGHSVPEKAPSHSQATMVHSPATGKVVASSRSTSLLSSRYDSQKHAARPTKQSEPSHHHEAHDVRSDRPLEGDQDLASLSSISKRKGIEILSESEPSHRHHHHETHDDRSDHPLERNQDHVSPRSISHQEGTEILSESERSRHHHEAHHNGHPHRPLEGNQDHVLSRSISHRKETEILSKVHGGGTQAHDDPGHGSFDRVAAMEEKTSTASKEDTRKRNDEANLLADHILLKPDGYGISRSLTKYPVTIRAQSQTDPSTSEGDVDQIAFATEEKAPPAISQGHLRGDEHPSSATNGRVRIRASRVISRRDEKKEWLVPGSNSRNIGQIGDAKLVSGQGLDKYETVHSQKMQHASVQSLPWANSPSLGKTPPSDIRTSRQIPDFERKPSDRGKLAEKGFRWDQSNINALAEALVEAEHRHKEGLPSASNEASKEKSNVHFTGAASTTNVPHIKSQVRNLPEYQEGAKNIGHTPTMVNNGEKIIVVIDTDQDSLSDESCLSQPIQSLPCVTSKVMQAACHDPMKQSPVGRPSTPCRFADSGCNVYFYSNPAKHEQNCKYRYVECPDSTCRGSIIFKDILYHLKVEHPFTQWIDEVPLDTPITHFWNLRSAKTLFKKNRTWVLVVWRIQKHKFIITLEKQKGVWFTWVYLLGNKAAAREFMVEQSFLVPPGQQSHTSPVYSIDVGCEDVITCQDIFKFCNEEAGNHLTTEGLSKRRKDHGYDCRLPISYIIRKKEINGHF